ncbi:hypothetical protein NEOKW01_2070 [Nematocida sp. AWRm80]|nr:hypothetical protein NEOKW01_2070 [Nematocida sp. AWRm80]
MFYPGIALYNTLIHKIFLYSVYNKRIPINILYPSIVTIYNTNLSLRLLSKLNLFLIRNIKEYYSEILQTSTPKRNRKRKITLKDKKAITHSLNIISILKRIIPHDRSEYRTYTSIEYNRLDSRDTLDTLYSRISESITENNHPPNRTTRLDRIDKTITLTNRIPKINLQYKILNTNIFRYIYNILTNTTTDIEIPRRYSIDDLNNTILIDNRLEYSRIECTTIDRTETINTPEREYNPILISFIELLKNITAGTITAVQEVPYGRIVIN